MTTFHGRQHTAQSSTRTPPRVGIDVEVDPFATVRAADADGVFHQRGHLSAGSSCQSPSAWRDQPSLSPLKRSLTQWRNSRWQPDPPEVVAIASIASALARRLLFRPSTTRACRAEAADARAHRNTTCACACASSGHDSFASHGSNPASLIALSIDFVTSFGAPSDCRTTRRSIRSRDRSRARTRSCCRRARSGLERALALRSPTCRARTATPSSSSCR